MPTARHPEWPKYLGRIIRKDGLRRVSTFSLRDGMASVGGAWKVRMYQVVTLVWWLWGYYVPHTIIVCVFILLAYTLHVGSVARGPLRVRYRARVHSPVGLGVGSVVILLWRLRSTGGLTHILHGT